MFEADFGRRLLVKNGLRVKLQDQPFALLGLLLEHPGDIVGGTRIRQTLWPADTFVEFDAGLNTAIKKLRAALGDTADNPRFIETVPRRGYRFLAPVVRVAPASTASDATTGTVTAAARPNPSRISSPLPSLPWSRLDGSGIRGVGSWPQQPSQSWQALSRRGCCAVRLRARYRRRAP